MFIEKEREIYMYCTCACIYTCTTSLKAKEIPYTLHQKGVQPSRAKLEYCFCLFLKWDGMVGEMKWFQERGVRR